MNKQKTLIFSLSAILFLAVSFIVYSWTEPTTMPSSYNPPINTSSIAQTKIGEIGASMFRDADNSSYYINPSGNSIIAGKIVTDNPTTAEDIPNSIATKGYVDGLFSGGDDGGQMVVSNLLYITGTTNPECPDDTLMLMKSWNSKTCSDPTYTTCGSCTTSEEWLRPDIPNPTCVYKGGYHYGVCAYDYICQAETWKEAICARVEDPLHGEKHTESQCTALGGTVVVVEDDVKICKFPVTTQCFKQLNVSPEGPCEMRTWEVNRTRTAVYECPAGWTKYKNFVTTKSKTWYPQEIIYLARTTDGREQHYTCHMTGDSCTANPANENVFSDKSTIDACGVYCDTPWNDLSGYYYGQAEVIEAGCY